MQGHGGVTPRYSEASQNRTNRLRLRRDVSVLVINTISRGQPYLTSTTFYSYRISVNAIPLSHREPRGGSVASHYTQQVALRRGRAGTAPGGARRRPPPGIRRRAHPLHHC